MGKDIKGKELGAGLSQRKDGVYQGRYKDRFGKTKYIYGAKLSELKRELAVAITENIQFASVKEEITLDMWFERWMETYKKKSVRPGTVRIYTHIYNKNISPYIGNFKLNSLVKSDIQKVVDNASDNGYKYERQDKIKVILTDLFDRAIEDDLMLKNPARGIKLRADREIKARTLTVEEQEAFLNASQGTFYDNLFHVAINTGLRPGELFALTAADIDMDNKLINVSKTLVYQKYLDDDCKTFHIEPPKTKQSYRKVPMNSECVKYMEKQLELKEVLAKKRPKEQNDYLFVTKFNTPLNSQIYSDAIRAVVREINIMRSVENEMPNFSGHTLRHTFATRCFEAGVQPKVVQSYLGHATLKMTMDLYTHVTEDKATEDIERIVNKAPNNVIDFAKKCV